MAARDGAQTGRMSAVERARAERHAEEALVHIRAAGLAPSPAAFAVFAAYVAGEDGRLVEAVDRLRVEGRLGAQEAVEALYAPGPGAGGTPAAGPGPTGGDGEIREAADLLQATLAQTGAAMQSYGRDLRRYGRVLGGVEEGLDLAPSVLAQQVVALRALVASLLSETRSMSQASAELETRVAKAEGEVRRLEARVVAAEREASTDSLTGLGNRRRFDRALADAVARSEATGEGFGLLLADVDHFKRINDAHGHELGDEVLRAVAGAISRAARRSDVVARYGGEEFAVLLPGAGHEVVRAAGERIRKAVEGRELVVRDGGRSLGTVTLSVGCAVRSPGEPADSLVRRADEALYAAKRGGRNRVALAPDRA